MPFSAGPAEIVAFFKNVSIVGGTEGVCFSQADRGGRPSGECFVQVSSEEDSKKALELHKTNMEHRYIEVYRSSRGEMNKKCGRRRSGVGGSNGPPREVHYVRLRGLPFGCSHDEIIGFMSGKQCSRRKDKLVQALAPLWVSVLRCGILEEIQALWGELGGALYAVVDDVRRDACVCCSMVQASTLSQMESP